MWVYTLFLRKTSKLRRRLISTSLLYDVTWNVKPTVRGVSRTGEGEGGRGGEVGRVRVFVTLFSLIKYRVPLMC